MTLELKNGNGKERFPRLGELIYWNFKDKSWDSLRVKTLADDLLGLSCEGMLLTERVRCALNSISDTDTQRFIWVQKNTTFYCGFVKVTEGKLSLRNALTLNCTKTGVEYIVVPGTEKLKETVAEQITFWEKHIDTGYMSKLIMTVLDRSDYIRFRDRGGFYFVLEKYRENINRLERFIQSVGGIELGRIGLVDEENVRNMIVDIFVQEANELQLQVNQYLEEVKSGEIKRIRKDGIETRLNELKKLREKMQRILETIDRERKDLEVSLENFEKELVMLTLEQEEV